MCPSKTLTRRTPKRKNRNTILIVGAIAAIAIIAAVLFIVNNNANNQNPTGPPNSVLLRTTMGDILIQLRNDTPITSNNFKTLVQEGVYNGTNFFKVYAGTAILGGDPSNTGFGDDSIPTIQDEFTSTSNNTRGTIAMYESGTPNSANSMFLINDKNNTATDGKYPVFGYVIKGMDVVDKISNVAIYSNSYMPVQNVTVTVAYYYG